jgi:2-polyprenyl-6-methoxyphenol hydroxylase-like FAD-dependent oxidoreductase
MDDFSIDKVRDMLWAGLGVDSHEARAKECDFGVLSIRHWTMSSLVAHRYVNKSNNMILVGDAFHAFPIAGGLGMNTGLQDAHNLARRLALLVIESQLPTKFCSI